MKSKGRQEKGGMRDEDGGEEELECERQRFCGAELQRKTTRWDLEGGIS